MPPVQSFTCPHCEGRIDRQNHRPDYLSISAASARDWTTYVLVCPHCNKSLGTYATPDR